MNLKLKAKILLGVMMLTPVFNVVKIAPTVCDVYGISPEEQEEVNRRLDHAIGVTQSVDLAIRLIHVGANLTPGNVDAFEQLLVRGASADDRAHGRNALHIASYKGYLDVVKELLLHSRTNINAVDGEGCTALHLAAALGRLEVVKELLRCHADINAVDGEGRTVLQYAAALGRTEVVKELLRCHADINAVDKNGCTVLHYAACNSSPDVLAELLCDARCNVNAVDKTGRTVLHCAAFNASLGVLAKLLCDAKCNVNAMDNIGRTALHWAIVGRAKFEARRPNLEALTMLLGNEGKPFRVFRTNHGQGGSYSVPVNSIRFLKVNECDNNGMTALHYATMHGDLDMVQELLKAGYAVDVNMPDKFGRTALHWAVISGRLDVLRVLLRHRDIQVDAVDFLDRTALHYAAKKGDARIVAELLRHGADKNRVDYGGNSVLRCASGGRDNDLIMALLAYDGDVD